MQDFWNWVVHEGGWLGLLAAPFCLFGLCLAVMSIVGYIAAGIDRLRYGDYDDPRRVRLVDNKIAIAAARRWRVRETERELAEMKARGEIVWTPSPIIESTRPGFREDKDLLPR